MYRAIKYIGETMSNNVNSVDISVKHVIKWFYSIRYRFPIHFTNFIFNGSSNLQGPNLQEPLISSPNFSENDLVSNLFEGKSS